MAATISAIRDGLKTVLQTIVIDDTNNDKLRAHDTIPADVHPPCAIVRPQSGEPKTLGTAARDRQEYRVQLILGLASERMAQDTLDALLSATGTKSVRVALNANPTLGIAGVKAVWKGWENYGSVEWNGHVYLSADVLITVEN